MKILLAILIFTGATFAQSVEVPQKLLDAANKAFIEVDALRKENAALKEENKAQAELITALQDESDAKTILIAEKNELILRKDAVIEAQAQTILKLEERDVIRLKEIEALRKMRCDKNIYLFGAIKTIRCK